VSGVRWDQLFADLVAQLDAVDAQNDMHALADLTRAEQATTLLTDRLRAVAHAHLVTVTLTDGTRLTARVAVVGPEWILIADAARRHLVPLVAVTTVEGLTPHTVPAPTGTGAGRGMPAALRALMRDRAVVRVRTLAGEVVGRVARVGKDHLDVSDAHGPGAYVVPYSALVCLSET
jgi:hypothetical protein